MEIILHEFPDLSLGERSRIANERWEYTRSERQRGLADEDLHTHPLDDTFVSRVGVSVTADGPGVFVRREAFPTLFRRFCEDRSPPQRLASMVYRLMGDRAFFERDPDPVTGDTLIDIVVKSLRHDLLTRLFRACPNSEWYSLATSSKNTTCPGRILNVLMMDIEGPEDKRFVIEVMINLVRRGLDPNTQILSPIDDLNCLTYKKYFPADPADTRLRCLARYTASTPTAFGPLASTPGREAREKSALYVGDTVFSAIIQLAALTSHKKFIHAVIRAGRIDLRTLVSPFRFKNIIWSEAVPYASVYLMGGKITSVDDIAHALIEGTPTWLMPVGGAFSPPAVIESLLCTAWSGFVASGGRMEGIIRSMVRSGFIIPRESLVWKFHEQDLFTRALQEDIRALYGTRPQKTIFETVLKNSPSPMETLLVAILRYPPALQLVRDDAPDPLEALRDKKTLKTLFRAWNREHVKKSTVVVPKSPINACSISTGEDIVPGSRVRGIVVDRGYVFLEPEIEYISTTGTNPYTMQPFPEEDIQVIRKRRDLIQEHWIMAPTEEFGIASSAYIDRILDHTSLCNMYVNKIDEMLSEVSFFIYSPKLESVQEKLNSLEVVRLSYLMLSAGPQTMIMTPLDDTFSTYCVGFANYASDPSDIEEINLCTSMRLNQLFGGRAESEQTHSFKTALLSWIYHVLESTKIRGRPERFLGRLFSLDFIITNYLSHV